MNDPDRDDVCPACGSRVDPGGIDPDAWRALKLRCDRRRLEDMESSAARLERLLPGFPYAARLRTSAAKLRARLGPEP